MLIDRYRHPNRCRHKKIYFRDLPTLPVLIMLLGYCTQGLLSDCPRMCECKWKGGKEAVSCTNANLTSIPLGLDQGTQALDLTNNNLARLKADEFSKAGLLNLQKVYLIKCRLKFIEKFAFRHLINLVELELSYNFLEMVPTHILSSMPELRELRLNGNSIQRISDNAFQSVPKLIRLDLSNCKIGTIEPKAFRGLELLERLKLDSNRLTVVEAYSFETLKNLNGIELTSNPWNCTCSLRPLREWMIKQNVPSDVPPLCKYPKRLTGKSWQGLELDEFACVPKILASDSKAYGIEGTSITISCLIDGIPEPDVKWLLRNKVIANHSSVTFNIGKKSYMIKADTNSSNLIIQTADIQDAGVYICVAENKAGKVEASVTLAVSKRPPEDTSQGKMILAGVVVSVVLVTALCTTAVCLISVRKRRQGMRWRNRRTASGRRHEENYEKIEMNHKVPTNNGGTNIAVSSVASDVPILAPTRRNGDYRGVPSIDTDQEADIEEDEEIGYEDNTETPTPTNANKSRESKLWTAAATGRSISSPNSGHWNSNLLDNNLDPDDLHIPRRTKEESRDDCKQNQNSTFGTFNQNRNKNISETVETQMEISPNIAISGNLQSSFQKTIQPHILRKQILQEGGSLYSSIPVSSSDLEDSETSFNCNLMETSRNVYNIQNPISGSRVLTKRHSGDGLSIHSDDNMYCTLPRKRTGYNRNNIRYQSCDSDTPLLPGSAYGSRESTKQLSDDYLYNYSMSSIYPRLNQKTGSYLNLVSSNQNLYIPNKSPQDSTPLLNVGALEQRYEAFKESLKSPSAKPLTMSTAAISYKFHATQLEKYKEEYQRIEEQLQKMKETCDNLKLLETYERLLRKRKYMDSLLNSNATSTSECEDLLNRKSILKKSITGTSRSPLLMNNVLQDTSLSTMTASFDIGSETQNHWTSGHIDSQKGFI